jgi:hypothetical protein
LRTKILFIVVPAIVILWSVDSAIRALDAREQADVADQIWRAQACRLDTLRTRKGPAYSLTAPSIETAVGAAVVGQAKVPSEPTPLSAGAFAVAPGAAEVEAENPDALPVEPLDGPQLVGYLRDSLVRHRIRVEEVRLGAVHLVGTEKTRSVRIRMAGRREALRQGLSALREDPRMAGLAEPRFEAGRRGESRVVIGGSVKLSATDRS